MKKIDIFPHIFPKAYFDKMVETIPNKAAVRRWLEIPVLYNLDARLKMMEEFGPDYQQILTLSMPAIEYVAPAESSPNMARLANDGMAELCRKYPERFPGFVAALPMHEVEPSVAEGIRALKDLGAKGIQLFTNVNGEPIDAKKYEPLFALAAEHEQALHHRPEHDRGW